MSGNFIPGISFNCIFRFILRPTKPIAKGSQLYATYAYTLSGTAERQKHLLEGKFFKCLCERCCDPTELGTNFSTLKCQQCHSGDVLTSDPLSNLFHNSTAKISIFPAFPLFEDSTAIWKCNKCPFEDAAENVERLLKALQDEIESTSSVESMENLLAKFGSVLHPNHFIMISIKNSLVDSYGHVKGHLLVQLPDALLRRKIELCEELLEILDVFEGGKSRARALMLFELHGPMVLHAKSQHQLANSSGLEYLRQLETARDLLSDSVEILAWEDEYVCKTLTKARVSLKDLENLIEDVKLNENDCKVA